YRKTHLHYEGYMNYFKMPKIRSKKIRQSAKGKACTLRVTNCSSRETVVFAHLNSNYKGVGNKSPDLFGCYACGNCHTALDAGKVSKGDQLRAMQETIMELYQQGLIEVK